jgi:hypothetical protein
VTTVFIKLQQKFKEALHLQWALKDLPNKLNNTQTDHKVFTKLQTFLKHKVQGIVRNGLHRLKEQLKNFQCMSMQVPSVTHTISKLYSISCHVFPSIWGVMEATALQRSSVLSIFLLNAWS